MMKPFEKYPNLKIEVGTLVTRQTYFGTFIGIIESMDAETEQATIQILHNDEEPESVNREYPTRLHYLLGYYSPIWELANQRHSEYFGSVTDKERYEKNRLPFESKSLSK